VIDRDLSVLLPETLRRVPRVLLEEADEVRGVLVAEAVGHLVHLVARGQQVALGFQDDLVRDQLGAGAARAAFAMAFSWKVERCIRSA
jgi:hypothetical protein